MSDWTIQGPKGYRGEIEPPGDKSISHRALIMGALAEGDSRITNFLPAGDCLRTAAAIRKLGVQIDEVSPTEFVVHGGRKLAEPDEPLDLGNSGTAMRLLSGVLAGQPFLSILTGDDSIRRRPMRRVCDPLRKMGAAILARSGDLAPLCIRGGGLQGIEYQSPVASAQVKSCILLAGLFAEGPTTVVEPTLSRDHTERMLRCFGAHLTREETTVTITPGDALKAHDVSVPGDVSSAAFFIAGALITPNSEIRVRKVGLNPARVGLLEALQQMGADITVEDREESTGEPVGTLVARTSELKGGEFGGEMIPRMIDEVPVLALVAAFAEGQTIIKDAAELRVKESDRVQTIATALQKMGAQVYPQPDGLIINGGTPLKATTVDSCGDHRIAMMAAVAATAVPGVTTITNVDCVGTSFPSFQELLQAVTS